MGLHVLAMKILHSGFHQRYAPFTSKDEQAKNRVAMQFRDSLGTPHTGSLKQQLNRQKCTVFGNCHRAKQPRMFFGVGLPTLRTAEPLKSIAVLPKLPTSEFALGAIHG